MVLFAEQKQIFRPICCDRSGVVYFQTASKFEQSQIQVKMAQLLSMIYWE